MKRCIKCGVEKSLGEFYAHSRMTDGHLNKCKDCQKSDVRSNRAKRLDHYRTYDLVRWRFCDERRETSAIQTKQWVRRNPEKRKAHIAVGNAVRDGRLSKPDTCQSCGNAGMIHGHHDDYNDKLDVRWLCVPCHAREHV